MLGLNKHLLKRNDKIYEELNIFKWQQAGITGKEVKVAIIGENVGTHHNGAFLVRQVVPDAEVIELNIIVKDNTRMTFTEAFQWCIDNDVDVACCNYLAINMNKDAFETSRKMKEKGIIMLASAGNSYDRINQYPAACEHWFATGAFDGIDGRMAYSQYGQNLLCLGHTNYISITPAGDYIPISHTSGTIQVIAGMAAMLKQLKPNLTSKEFEEFVKDNAIRLSTEDWNEEEGWGLMTLPREIPKFETKHKEGESMKFKDVPKGRWSEKNIDLVSDLGLMNGYPNGTFKPTEKLTREELATVLANLMNNYDIKRKK